MRIGIILHPYGEDKPAGLGRAIYEITRVLIERNRDNHYIVYLRSHPKILPSFVGTNWEVKILGNRFFWLDLGLLREHLDICFFNTPIMPFFAKPKKSVVITYDYAYYYFDSSSRWLKFYHRFSLRRADRIIAISEYTKRETIKLFDIPAERISVIYLGFKDFCENMTNQTPPIPEKFFLFVGVIKERKNVFGVVKAFHILKKKAECEHILVIIGKGSGSYYESIISYIKENNLEKDILIVGRIDDDALAYYYKHAEALVFPSFIEGFGFPVLEAMSCGLPVITSTTSSLPEAAGDAALLVNPHDTGAIADAMDTIITDTKIRSSLVARGYKQTERFSWDNTAQEYEEIVVSLANRGLR